MSESGTKSTMAEIIHVQDVEKCISVYISSNKTSFPFFFFILDFYGQRKIIVGTYLH